MSRSNAAAVDRIDRWPDWDSPALVVAGPKGAGKTHLAHIWRARSLAAWSEAPTLTEAAVGAVNGRRGLVVENIDEGVADDRLLFHVLNSARELSQPVLLTSRVPPGELMIALPDLRSRLRALPVVAIEAPDEALIGAVLVKLFADRQLLVEPRVVAYLALHVDRSMAAVADLVATLDAMSLALHRRVTRPLAAAALERARDTNDGRPPANLSQG